MLDTLWKSIRSQDSPSGLARVGVPGGECSVKTAERVGVIGDWDADGVVSAAMIVYSQEVIGRFPLNGRNRVRLLPSSPRTLPDSIVDLDCHDAVVILDIPYTRDVEKALEYLASICGGSSKIYYFDHHSSTIENVGVIEERFDAYIVVGRSPTSIIVKNFLERLNIKFPVRLAEFAKAVGILEKGLKAEASKQMVSLAASISKLFNRYKSRDLWVSYVKWLSSPLPFEKPPIPNITGDPLKAGIEASRELDAEAKNLAMDLIFKAKNLGYVKLVDARGMRGKGSVMGVVSALYKMVKFPIAVLVSKATGETLLVIRSPDERARRLAEKLASIGLLEDIGGHESLTVSKVREGVKLRDLEDALRRASFEVAREHHA